MTLRVKAKEISMRRNYFDKSEKRKVRQQDRALRHKMKIRSFGIYKYISIENKHFFKCYLSDAELLQLFNGIH